ncbi:MAG: hypothetical protein KAS72_15860 [Phycisphaerales bacterium]|nr:hypothetical protein [Phycisphaerales bacterium]
MILMASLIWAFLVWLTQGQLHDAGSQSVETQRWVSLAIAGLSAVSLLYFMLVVPKAPDELKTVTGGRYFEADGVCFMPLVRLNRGRAEISLYYQNHHENPCEVIIHLRPPSDTIAMREGARDIHFAFLARGSAFGVIHQPIGVRRKIQGQVINVQLAAATRYTRGIGARVRRAKGMPCGTLNVDWGAAMRTLDHEISGEVEMLHATTLHLAMPSGVEEEAPGAALWTKEQISLA